MAEVSIAEKSSGGSTPLMKDLSQASKFKQRILDLYLGRNACEDDY